MPLELNTKPFKLTFGERGEMAGWGYLVRHGFQIIEKNYRCALGELDVVARKGKRLYFIEIKTRTHHRQGRPEEAVHSKKQTKLAHLAQWYLKEKKIGDAQAGFAVLGITWPEGREPEIRFIENAFDLKESS
ncbi:MAG: hypothetical protein A2Z83_02355 [Omnitrophica bacterium GWA2_52_8]|nr:MAG: hypothetical protein A2Z83_02355 [Omnitrophica bacterium GWA2_52_8]